MKLTKDIINDFKAGHLDSFYREAYPALLTFASRILTDGYAFLAEDCVQDVIFKSYQERDKIVDGNSWRSYLYTSIHNSAISLLRRNKVHSQYVEQNQEQFEKDSAQLFIEQETLDLLYDAISHLPAKYQTIFEMSFEQGLSNPEIAELLQLSISGVKKQKSKMISMLRDNLNKEALTLLLMCI